MPDYKPNIPTSVAEGPGTSESGLRSSSRAPDRPQSGEDNISAVVRAFDSMCDRMDKLSKRMDEWDAKAKKDAEGKGAEHDQPDHGEMGAEEDRGRNGLGARQTAASYDSARKDSYERSQIQARADTVFGSLGEQASRPLDGETSHDYARRLAGSLKGHSKTWRDVDLSRLDDASFSIAQDQIYKDAAEYAKCPNDVPRGQIREVKTIDEAGHRISNFYGQESFIVGMMPPTRIMKIRSVAAIRKDEGY
ncbi:hypothetical protein [Rhodoblastus sp.]|uniref:hypothetical protein n=1 Tax=Rhodoblastus sp. TaxID=1962975 RepID=UPI003F954FA8